MHAAHHVCLHDVVLVGQPPVLYRQVLPPIHLLKDRLLQRLIEPLYVAYRMVLVWDARLQLYWRLTQSCPPLDRGCDELVVQSQHLQCVTCATHIYTQRLQVHFKVSVSLNQLTYLESCRQVNSSERASVLAKRPLVLQGLAVVGKDLDVTLKLLSWLILPIRRSPRDVPLCHITGRTGLTRRKVLTDYLGCQLLGHTSE